jgi:uncharacterized protein (TIGR03790 family)
LAAALKSGADDPAASTNAPGPARPPPAWMTSTLSTNSASSTFLENHPELAQPGEPGSNLTLRPEPGSTNAAPEILPPSADTVDETYRLTNPNVQPEDLASHLLVVFNTADPDSPGLAQYYASRRNIPPERVLGIACPLTENMTRQQYEETIRQPILSYITGKNWMTRQAQRARVGPRILDLLTASRNDIWAIVLMRGIPLKIENDASDQDGMESEPQLQTNAAAVDNELALLPIFGLPKGGYVPNPFFDNQVSGIKRIGPDLARSMILVTRLDGPTPDDVRRMIDDCLAAEKNRLAGLAVVDTRGFTDINNGYTSGDIWLRSARDSLVADGWTVKFDDKPDLIPATDPCNQVALYLGWYSSQAAGPWVTSPKRFVPGAIAYHLHSYSGSTVRSPTSNWVGPLIANGADATMGMVYEPYLAMTPHEDIFTRRLLQGDYFAEAAYASERGLSWMLTVVGDPLYRPFLKPLRTALADASMPHTPHDDWLLLQQVRRDLVARTMSDDRYDLVKTLDAPGTGPVAEEGLGDLLQKLNDPSSTSAIEEAYQKASAGNVAPIDRIRVGLKLSQFYIDHGQDARGQAQLDVLRDLFPDDAKRFGVADLLVPTTAPPDNAAADKSTSPTALPRLSRPSMPSVPVPK